LPLNFDDGNDLCYISHKERVYRIVPFMFGKLPVITNESSEPLIFCAVQPNFKSASIYGVLNEYSFNNRLLFDIKTKNPINSGFKFIGFSNLENLSS